MWDDVKLLSVVHAVLGDVEVEHHRHRGGVDKVHQACVQVVKGDRSKVHLLTVKMECRTDDVSLDMTREHVLVALEGESEEF